MTQRRMITLATAMWLGVILWSTLRPAPDQVAVVARIPWYCLLCGADGVADALLNLLLFFPLGIGLRLLSWRLRTAAVAMVALTVAIELTQGNLLAGRDGSLGDVVTNSVGGLVGFACVPLIAWCRRPSPKDARRLALGTLLLHLTVWIITAAALRPAVSDGSIWSSQVTGGGVFSDPVSGDLLSERWNGVALREGTIAHPRGLADSSHVVVQFRRDDRPLPPSGATLFQVLDTALRVQLMAAQRQANLMMEIPLRGSRWLLHSPVWEYAGAFDLPIGQVSAFDWDWSPRGAILTTRPGNAASVTTRHPVTLSLGWAFIHPFTRRIGSSAPLWSALWLAWWFGLLGWFAGWLDAGPRWAAACTAVGVFAAATALTGHSLVLSDVLAAVVAFVALSLGSIAAQRRGAVQG